ncbi:hypothetical protein [Corynebacterium sp. TAE3-ERU2]|uniref:hypothetical protein n=1 Tax=Corynebacterium sp. TAE3-ERU2 TaxID=2849497 RepID=UPI001C470DE2|nr:hypothetical protein [Corynebacterium sp. TAE3-ERU2]MBV7301522.1 hypothetical protein [Corynebacterium sp. TAE3-ERU2]
MTVDHDVPRFFNGGDKELDDVSTGVNDELHGNHSSLNLGVVDKAPTSFAAGAALSRITQRAVETPELVAQTVH